MTLLSAIFAVFTGIAIWLGVDLVRMARQRDAGRAPLYVFAALMFCMAGVLAWQGVRTW